MPTPTAEPAAIQEKVLYDFNPDGFKKFTEVGEQISGNYLGYEANEAHVPGVPGSIPGQYSVVNDEGVSRMNSTAQLEKLNDIPVGTLVTITYEGETLTRNKMRLNLFSVSLQTSDPAEIRKNIIATRLRALGGQAPLATITGEIAAPEPVDEVDHFKDE